VSGSDGPYVFDSGPLSHFAEAGWLGLLGAAVGAAEAWIPVTVRGEIADGVNEHPHLRGVLETDWLTLRDIVMPEEQAAFAKCASRLLGDDQRKNLGECGVLALANVHGGIAVLDDGAARQIASEFGVEVKTTVALLCDLVRDKHLGLDLASTIADALIQTEYRLPFEPGGFKMFVLEHDLVPYE
jgi:predicted nucleic acid-binding protein